MERLKADHIGPFETINPLSDLIDKRVTTKQLRFYLSQYLGFEVTKQMIKNARHKLATEWKIPPGNVRNNDIVSLMLLELLVPPGFYSDYLTTLTKPRKKYTKFR